ATYTTTGAQAYFGPVTLTQATTTFTTTNSNVSFNGAVNGTAANAQSLTVAAGAGDVAFAGAVGTAAVPLNAVLVSSAHDLTFGGAVQATSVTQTTGTGTTTVSGAVTVTGAGTPISLTNAAITLNAGLVAPGGTTVALTATTGAVTNPAGATPVGTAGSLAVLAATGVGTQSDPLRTQVANLEAQTSTGGIFVSNTGNLAIGGVTPALAGVRVTGASGDINLTTAGTLSILNNGEIVK